jgi:hypothetical protein
MHENKLEPTPTRLYRGKQMSEEEIIRLETTRTFMQHEIGQALKIGTFHGGVTIADVAEELKAFYDKEELNYLKNIL